MAILFIRHWACRMKGVIRNAANKVSLRIPKEGRKSGFTGESQVQRHWDGLWIQINGAKQRRRPLADRNSARHASRGPSPANLSNTLAVQQWTCPGWNEVRSLAAQDASE